MFYVYEWFIKETGEIIYVGKGHKNRWKVRKHNRLFNEMIKRFDCDSRIIKEFESEEKAFRYEHDRIIALKSKGQCVCNIYNGGCGGDTQWWSEERRKEYSENNVMKSHKQRERMSKNNPMKNASVAKTVGEKHKRKVIVEDRIYNGLIDVAKKYGVTTNAITYWIERGYTPDHKSCYYYGDKEPEIKIRTHSVNMRPVIVDGIRFDSVKEAAEFIGGKSTGLVEAMKNNRLYKGHTCKYDNQQPSQMKSDNSNLEGSETNE